MISTRNPYGYIYKVTINNPESSFHETYYIGLRTLSKPLINVEMLDDNYYGSGRLIKAYLRKYCETNAKGLNPKNVSTLNKVLLHVGYNDEALRDLEKTEISDLFITDSFVNGGKCLNLKAGGGNGKLSLSTREQIRESVTRTINVDWLKTCPHCEQSFKARKKFQTYCSKICGAKSRVRTGITSRFTRDDVVAFSESGLPKSVIAESIGYSVQSLNDLERFYGVRIPVVKPC